MLKVKGYIHETVKFDGAVRREHKTFNRYHAYEVRYEGEWESGLPIDKAEALIRMWNSMLRRRGTEGRYSLDLDGIVGVVTNTEAK